MPLTMTNGRAGAWQVRKIAVVGPGIVGMPMAALLAHARIRIGSNSPATVTVIQRNSPTSGWKVGAINEGRSPIGGIEPDLDRIVAETVAEGLLGASHDYEAAADADVILVSVQTDKKGQAPDYGPMFEALTGLAEALQRRPAGNIPLIVFESTLAPSSMATVIKEHFGRYGLVEGRDVLLGNSPNRVMPGRLVERVAASDKIVAGLHPDTPELIHRLYGHIVTKGELHRANSMTAEVVKTLENAYRDVRIAYAAEIVRYCDANDIDFYAVRDAVNARLAQTDAASTDPNAVPSGGLLVPTVGVGGHCLPKDGILLWWRKLEAKGDISGSLILESRVINDESPEETIALAERAGMAVDGRAVALLGTAYRFNSEDTRNSPTLALARLLLQRGCRVTLHDPYVYATDQNLKRFQLTEHFTQDLGAALADAELVVVCTAHRVYATDLTGILAKAPKLRGLVDGCNAFPGAAVTKAAVAYAGIGKGTNAPEDAFVDFVYEGFRAVETGVANEVASLVDFLNGQYADGAFNQVRMEDVQRIAGTCVTGCAIVAPGPLPGRVTHEGFTPRLVARALAGVELAV